MKKKLFGYLAIFFVCYGLTYWWLNEEYAFDLKTLPEIGPGFYGIGVALSLSIFIFDAFRYQVTLACLDEHITFPVAIESSIINFFFAWVTPGAVMAAPMTAYALVKRGVGFEAALLASFGKSFIGTFYLLVFGLLTFILSDLEKTFSAEYYYAITSAFGGSLAFMVVLLVLGLQHRRISEIGWLPVSLRKVVEKLGHLFAKDVVSRFLKVTFTQFTYFLLLIGLTSYILQQFATLDHLPRLALSFLFIVLIYLSPTPGGVGLAEAIGIPLLGIYMPAERAVWATFFIRFFIVYLPIVVGLVYFALPYSRRLQT